MARVRGANLAVAAGACALAALLGGGSSSGASRAPAPLTRYSVAGGCFRVSGGAVPHDAGPLRLQATRLGQYLLYTRARKFLTDTGRGTLAAADAPSGEAEWDLRGDANRGFGLTDSATRRAFAVTLRPASGCAAYPEAEVGATGATFHGAGPDAAVSGTVDAHTHVTAFELWGGDWHCGRPWHPWGIPYALPDCSGIQTGTNAAIQNLQDWGSPVHPHDPRGWPRFKDWPGAARLSYDGIYYTGIERAWKAGLRLMVTQFVGNEVFCSVMTMRRLPCNDMANVRTQARDLRELQDYIDAQSGGPGKGFFRIVRDPFEARRVINAGKLAVVEGIEVSDLFGCGERMGKPLCTREQIDAGLREVRALGVRTLFPIHKFDNAFGGVKMDAGETGAIINAANHLATGRFWDVKTCTGAEQDHPQLALAAGDPLTSAVTGLLRTLGLPGTLPVYPKGPHCNTRGLTALGRYLVDRLAATRTLLELDHMGALTADQSLAELQRIGYGGVISAHSWNSPQENPLIYRLGGFVTPAAGGGAPALVAQWRADKRIAARGARFGFGYGADMGGNAVQSGPAAGHPISYPFHAYRGGVSFSRERWGERSFDLNREGVANYGMYADWLAQLQVLGGAPLMNDMFRGAEAYLETWERAYGVPAEHCLPADGPPLRLGMSTRAALYAAGQPLARGARSLTWCAGSGTLRAVFSDRDRLVQIVRGRGTR